MTDPFLPTEPEAGGPAEPSVKISPAMQIGQLITDHHRAVYGYAYRLAGSVADAEDLAQQTFLVAQQKLDQVRDPSKVRSWLFSVLRSCYLKSRRKRVPTPASTLEMEINGIAEPVPDEDQIDRQLLQSALNELPDEFRIVLVMFYFEECSYKEISSQLDLPMGTVMSRLSRAKGRLRQVLLGMEVGSRCVNGKPPDEGTDFVATFDGRPQTKTRLPSQ